MVYLKRACLRSRAIAEVALDHDHGLGHLEHLVGREEADDVREARIGLRLAVRGAEAAAHREVEAEQLALFSHRRGWR